MQYRCIEVYLDACELLKFNFMEHVHDTIKMFKKTQKKKEDTSQNLTMPLSLSL